MSSKKLDVFGYGQLGVRPIWTDMRIACWSFKSPTYFEEKASFTLVIFSSLTTQFTFNHPQLNFVPSCFSFRVAQSCVSWCGIRCSCLGAFPFGLTDTWLPLGRIASSSGLFAAAASQVRDILFPSDVVHPSCCVVLWWSTRSTTISFGYFGPWLTWIKGGCENWTDLVHALHF